MKTLKLINYILQNPEITTFEFVSTSLNSTRDCKLSLMETIAYLSGFYDCEGTEWHVNRIGNEFLIFSY